MYSSIAMQGIDRDIVMYSSIATHGIDRDIARLRGINMYVMWLESPQRPSSLLT